MPATFKSTSAAETRPPRSGPPKQGADDRQSPGADDKALKQKPQLRGRIPGRTHRGKRDLSGSQQTAYPDMPYFFSAVYTRKFARANLFFVGHFLLMRYVERVHLVVIYFILDIFFVRLGCLFRLFFAVFEFNHDDTTE